MSLFKGRRIVCLFVCSFQNRCDEAFSTEPVKNSAKSASFQHVQQVCIFSVVLTLPLVFTQHTFFVLATG